MKKFKNEFTNQEQSKMLLELGMSSNCADGYIRHYKNTYIFECDCPNHLLGSMSYEDTKHIFPDDEFDYIIPSWSVGRLIAIYECCTGLKYNHNTEDTSIMEDILVKIQSFINANMFDFKKLEE